MGPLSPNAVQCIKTSLKEHKAMDTDGVTLLSILAHGTELYFTRSQWI
uniref:Uncharacterized protein n=1 Tax=Anguilla anguilla TaxID=7936 RepID=A0A0E9U6L7_ANGAN